MTALVLTAIAIAIGVVLIAVGGRDGALIFLLPFPVALALLWRSTAAERFDERGALDPRGVGAVPREA